ncbi:MAG: transcriptional regulator [Proteobacteria bacterium]|nr:transcriptional regulator [Pseudomonadota bacterium]
MSQSVLAQAGGVARSSQAYFEADTHLPGGAYLIAIDKLGIDVLYVLTGQRAGGAAAAPPAPLPRDEQDLLALYRGSSPAGKAAIRATGVAVAQPLSAPARKGKKG